MSVYQNSLGTFRRVGNTVEMLSTTPGPSYCHHGVTYGRACAKCGGLARPLDAPQRPTEGPSVPATAPEVAADATAALRACGLKAHEARRRVAACTAVQQFVNVNDLIVAAFRNQLK